ncbi:MAG: hypothetical protein RBS57_18610, partial [Desulforhabdus sp.]|nr:hypothetical protein [Desulforhabdus sp.]
MAIKDSDEVRENEGLPDPLQWFGRRERLWAWCKAAAAHGGPVGPAGYQNVQLRNQLITGVIGTIISAEAISNEAKSYLLPIEEFGWIKGERRQEIWLYHRGVFQGSCRVIRFHQAASSSVVAGRSGLSMTVPIGDQLRVAP